MGILNIVKRSENPVTFVPYINTGTLFDMATGKFRTGCGNTFVLDGGISSCMGISGRAQTYKSGIAGSLVANAMLVHPQAEALIFDSENTISGPERYDDFTPVSNPISDRIGFYNSTTTNLTDFYDKIKQIADAKLANKKDYIVESPFKDIDGRPIKVWIPTFVLIDSFSRARSNKGDDQFDKNSVDDSAMNTFYLYDGGVKSRIMNDLPTRAAKAGIYVIMTAHVGDKMDLDQYNPSPKQLQYMKNSDRMKNVGSNFEFLTTALLQTNKATVLQDSNKHCLYPTASSTDSEVNQVDTTLVRCKNNSAGVQIPYVLSQNQGILKNVTNFQLLRNCKNFGMNVKGNNQGFSPLLLPDLTLTRNNIRDTFDNNYRAARAVELISHLCFIQNYWSTYRMPEFVHTPIDKFAELLTHNEKMSVDRVLESTSVWSTSKQERERLTILDVLAFLTKK